MCRDRGIHRGHSGQYDTAYLPDDIFGRKNANIGFSVSYNTLSFPVFFINIMVSTMPFEFPTIIFHQFYQIFCFHSRDAIAIVGIDMEDDGEAIPEPAEVSAIKADSASFVFIFPSSHYILYAPYAHNSSAFIISKIFLYPLANATPFQMRVRQQAQIEKQQRGGKQ